MDVNSDTPASVKRAVGVVAHWKVSVTGERLGQAADQRGE
jgi:hypothetical protein